MHTVFALPCFVVVIHWLIFPYPPGLLHWHCGNLTIAPVSAKQPWWILDKYFIWIHYERLHNHNKTKHNKPVCTFLGIYCTYVRPLKCTHILLIVSVFGRSFIIEINKSWWRHQMETFSALLALCKGNPSVTGGFLSQRPVTWSFDVFFDLRLNKRLSK